MEEQPKDKFNLRNRIFFYIVFLILTILTLILLRPLFSVIALSLISVIMLKPVYTFFMGLSWVKGRGRMAASLTLIAYVLLLVAPVYFLARVTANQLSIFFEQLSTLDVDLILQNIENFLDSLPFTDDVALSAGSVTEIMQSLARGAASMLADVAVAIGTSLPMLILQAIIFVVLVITLLPEFDNLVTWAQKYSPLGSDISELYYRKTTAMVSSLVMGIFLIAFVQGAVMGVFFWIAGISFAFLLSLLSMVLAILPVVGISYLALIVAGVLLITGDVRGAVIVLFGFYGVVNWIDVFLRPKLISKEAYMNFALVLLGIFGGLMWAGFLGLFYGPVIILLLVTTINIYTEQFAKEDSLVIKSLIDSRGPSSEGEESASEV